MLLTVFMWSLGPLFVKYFTRDYNVWTQNAFRYACAACVLLIIALIRGRERYRLSRAQWKRLLLVAVANVLMQVSFASIFYFLYPGVATLVQRVNVVFTVVLSFLIFHDERQVIRSPRFLVGASLAVLGVVVVILGRDPELLARLEVSEGDFWIGVALAVTQAFFVSVYALAIKHAVRNVPPLVSFTHVSWMTALALSALMLMMGGVEDLWTKPATGLGLMAFSAVLSILIAHSCYYAALQSMKLVVSTSLMQLIPVLICGFSAIIYGERLSALQIVGGAMVISGAWLASLAQAREEKGADEPES